MRAKSSSKVFPATFNSLNIGSLFTGAETCSGNFAARRVGEVCDLLGIGVVYRSGIIGLRVELLFRGIHTCYLPNSF